MILAQAKGGNTPMTPSQAHHLPADLSPRSSGSSSVLSDSPSPTSAKDLAHHHLMQALHGGGVEDISPLQRLQFAIERNSLFSNLFNGNGGLDEARTRAELLSPVNHRPPVQVTPPIKKAKTPEPTPPVQYVQSPVGSPNSDPANIFQCPLCSIVCNGRHSFNEHLVTHTQHHACPKCDFLTTSEEQLRDHLQEIHELTDPDSLDDPEVSVPKVNSQGKVKTFKCKQCEHVSVTKSEFWAHSKSHIRSEKMLNCPKCSFVTEYKHHLEYHLRNHFGSKPFVCTKCPYTCVNKSMLNSHLKSHSNIYQYRCADCSYATKYCHSLKLHLRKYNHNPSMVLNPDGTPNPLPIIDVYGTRRGPKMKRTPSQQPSQKNGSADYQPINSNGSTTSSSIEDSQDMKDLAAPNSVSPPIPRKMQHVEAVMVTPPLKRIASDTSDSDHDMRRLSRGGIPMSPVTPVQQSKDHNNVIYDLSPKNPLELYAAALNQYLFANPLLHMNPGANAADLAQQQGQMLSHFLKNQGHPGPMLSGVINNNNNNIMGHPQNLAPLDLRQLSKHDHDHNKTHNAELDSKRRKRKGKAIRHEKYQHEQDDGQALDFSAMGQRAAAAVEEAQSSMMCKYCEISFPDRVLYSMHMSYHSGDRDPFHCKSCGKKTQDKVAFFLHLTTDSH